MKVFWLNIDSKLQTKSQGSSLVIGNFDGIHKGHLLLFEKAREISSSRNIPLNVLTFFPHPSLLFYPERESFAITPLRSKIRIFKDLGVDNVFLCKFTFKVASLEPEKYVDSFFKNIIKPEAIIVGDDHYYGKNRAGSIKTLRKMGYHVEVVERDLHYSSSLIRELIKDGEMETVYDAMGRHYEVEDFVHHGEKVAGKLGYKTANLYVRKYIKPRHGVYATKTFIDGEWLNGFSYFGKRPTLSNIEPVLENHIFDKDFDLYNKRIRIKFIKHIRDEIKFNSIDEIKSQLMQDMIKAKEILL